MSGCRSAAAGRSWSDCPLAVAELPTRRRGPRHVAMATTRSELADQLSSLSLFADVGAAELAAVAHILDERRFADGERVIRQGVTGSAFYVILAGEAMIRVDGKDFGKLARGAFFCQLSWLLSESTDAD